MHFGSRRLGVIHFAKLAESEKYLRLHDGYLADAEKYSREAWR